MLDVSEIHIDYLDQDIDEKIRKLGETNSTIDDINIGNSICKYKDAKPRTLLTTLVKPNIINFFVNRIVKENNNKLTMLLENF